MREFLREFVRDFLRELLREFLRDFLRGFLRDFLREFLREFSVRIGGACFLVNYAGKTTKTHPRKNPRKNSRNKSRTDSGYYHNRLTAPPNKSHGLDVGMCSSHVHVQYISGTLDPDLTHTEFGVAVRKHTWNSGMSVHPRSANGLPKCGCPATCA